MIVFAAISGAASRQLRAAGQQCSGPARNSTRARAFYFGYTLGSPGTWARSTHRLLSVGRGRMLTNPLGNKALMGVLATIAEGPGTTSRLLGFVVALLTLTGSSGPLLAQSTPTGTPPGTPSFEARVAEIVQTIAANEPRLKRFRPAKRT